MSKHDPLLKIRFDGAAVGPGRISVSHLLSFLDGFNKVLQRTARVLLGEADSIREGPTPREIREEVEFALVQLTHGSPATIIGLDRIKKEQSFPEMDFGFEILEKALGGLEAVGNGGANGALPPGYDRGVLMAWRGTGSVLGKGINTIQFTLNNREKPLQTTLTLPYLTQIRERIRGPEINIRTIEGRLLMADFKEAGTRCRIHPSVGDPILCHFGEEQKEDVLENILQYVRVIGEASEDPGSKKIKSVKIHDIECLADFLSEATQLPASSLLMTGSFWESRTIKELAILQNVPPIEDISVLFGTWPGEPDDGFEEAIDQLRHGSSDKGSKHE